MRTSLSPERRWKVPKQPLPTKWKGAFTDVDTLTDAERRARGLACFATIRQVVGWNAAGVKDGAESIAEAVAYARARGKITIDTETTGFDPFCDRIILVQIGDKDRQYLIWWETVSDAAKALVRDLWTDETVRKVGVNLKFDAKMFLGNQGFDWRGAGLVDCQILEQLIGCGLLGDIGPTMKLTGMGQMAMRWLGWKLVKDEEVRTGWGDMTPGQWFPPRAACASDEEFEAKRTKGIVKLYYAADDCVIPSALVRCQAPWIEQLELVEAVRLEMEFLPDLADMEARGLQLDWDAWETLAFEAQEGYRTAQQALDRLFDVTVTYRVDLDGTVIMERDKNYASKDQLKDLIHAYMREKYAVDVICNNKQLKESLIRHGMNPVRAEMLIEKKLVPNPDKPGKNKQVGYPLMTDYIDGSTFVRSKWNEVKGKLSDLAFPMSSTDSKKMKLLRILHETPDALIDDVEEIPTKLGLPPELVDPILALREFGTKLSRYAFAWQKLINPVSGRIHTDTTQAAATTNRLTTRPNFQNLPGDKRYRACITVRPGYVMVGADFSQIEPRVIAELSSDPLYMKIFWSERPGTPGFDYWCGPEVTEPLDLYGTVGAALGNLPPDGAKKSIAKLDVHKPGRSKSKVSVLGLGFGTQKKKFNIQMTLDLKTYTNREESDAQFDGFWSAVPYVKKTLDALSDIVDPKKSKRKVWHPLVEDEVWFSESLNGNKRFFDGVLRGWWTQGRNHPVQASAAAILKRTVVEFSKWLRANAIDGYVILTAHDEILCEVIESQAARVAKALEHFMSAVGERYCPHVPITASATLSPHWIKD